MTTINFEGIAPSGSETGLTERDGIAFLGLGAADSGAFRRGDLDGYNAVRHGKGVGFTFGDSTDLYSGRTTFSLQSGHFAAAWRTGLSVTFTAYGHSHSLIGSETFTLDQTDTVLKFDHMFKHVNEVTITTSGGTAGTGSETLSDSDLNSGTALAIDNLKIVLDHAREVHAVDHGSDAFVHVMPVPVHDWV